MRRWIIDKFIMEPEEATKEHEFQFYGIFGGFLIGTLLIIGIAHSIVGG